MFALGVSLLFLSSCKKENSEINHPEENPSPAYQFPSKVGSYWVYNWYAVDSTGIETQLSYVDSVFILGDTLINGHSYSIYKGNNVGGNYNTYFQRDSSGYIVNEHGHVSFTYVDFTTLFTSGSEQGFWDYYGHSLEGKVSLTIPLGTYQAFVSEYYIYSPNGTAINNCGDIDHSYKTYYSSGIGQIQHETAYYTEFQNECKYRVRRLVDYYIPE